MTAATLINKLHKLKIESKVIDCNGYNKDVVFTINGLVFKAGFNIDKEIVEDFCRDICYDISNQEMQRRFFKNLTQLLKYANS